MHRPVICALRAFLVPAGLLLIAADSGAQDSEGQPATSFAKFEGIDGEATDAQHKNWIDVLSIDWNIRRPTVSGSGQKRRLGAPIVGDLTISMRLDKASPELALKGLTGEVIPKLEIEQTANYGPTQATYIRYELTNVVVTSYQTSDTVDSSSSLVIKLSLGFEEIKVTYTENDAENDAETGGAKDSTEMSWKIEEGVK